MSYKLFEEAQITASLFISESGFIGRSSGCSGLSILNTYTVSRHECALQCLSTVNCVMFFYKYQESPPLCVTHDAICNRFEDDSFYSYIKSKNNFLHSRRYIQNLYQGISHLSPKYL